ncbi:hypothetical protein [Cryptosporangium aurantiacum]|uniref:Uncharacterized protein n=1 Tax=Cryptosporangium aurantiacum TaxID=134849 RepID=A0A1M7RND3_9ACTN|nr:hypothetical protein [Cryptosporangium aurantiacum]SHN47754.1 hypothetical protein SAMN05443668_12757 [Cryptosporangium aurantiacum]
MPQKYPDVLYSKETSAFIMAMVALQRANGVSVDDALDWALDRYWQQFGRPHSSFTLNDLQAFIRDVAPPQPGLSRGPRRA